MAYFRCGGGGKKSLILPTNPVLSIKSDDAKLILSWTQPKTEIAVDHYNVYYSTTTPIAVANMIKAGETTSTTYTLNGLTNETLYYVAVESVDVDGYENASMWEVKNGKPSAIKMLLSNSSLQMYLSNDGTNWKWYEDTPATSTSSNAFIGFADGKYYLLDYGNKKIFYSEDLTSWSSVTMSNITSAVALIETTNKKILVGNSGLAIIADKGSENWTYKSRPSSWNTNYTIRYDYCEAIWYKGYVYLTVSQNLRSIVYVLDENWNFIKEISMPEASAYGISATYVNYFGFYIENDVLYVCGGTDSNSSEKGVIAKTTNGSTFTAYASNSNSYSKYCCLTKFKGNYYCTNLSSSGSYYVYYGSSISSMTNKLYVGGVYCPIMKISNNVLFFLGSSYYLFYTTDGTTIQKINLSTIHSNSEAPTLFASNR